MYNLCVGNTIYENPTSALIIENPGETGQSIFTLPNLIRFKDAIKQIVLLTPPGRDIDRVLVLAELLALQFNGPTGPTGPKVSDGPSFSTPIYES